MDTPVTLKGLRIGFAKAQWQLRADCRHVADASLADIAL
jgi:hypothetical protein